MTPLRRQPLSPIGPDIAPQAVPQAMPVPLAFDAPPPLTQEGDEGAQQALGGLAMALQKKLGAQLPSGTAAKTVDAPPRTPFNPMQQQQLNQALLGGYA